MSNNLYFPLKDKDKAVYHNRDTGPNFGRLNLQIADNSNEYKKCLSIYPFAYKTNFTGNIDCNLKFIGG